MSHAVTILVPHYKTLPLTQICLRLLREHTDLSLAKVIVIENGSQDDSLDYLQSLSWLEVIARQKDPNETPVESHARALDLGLSRVTTPYVLSIHTDSLVMHPGWLSFLLAQIEKDEKIAGVGSWKLESKSTFRHLLKRIEYAIQWSYAYLRNGFSSPQRPLKQTHYLRSHCALYRTALLKKYGLHFSDGNAVAGQFIHHQLVQAGHDMVFLPSEVLIKYLMHLNHATTILNPELSRRKSVDRDVARLRKQLESIS